MTTEEKFYDKLLAYKGIHKIGWLEIGKVIGFQQATIRMAVDRKSLSRLEIVALSKHFDIEKNKIDDITSSKTLSDFTNLQIVEYIADNLEQFKTLATFRMLIKKV
jgi:hypothetical protein